MWELRDGRVDPAAGRRRPPRLVQEVRSDHGRVRGVRSAAPRCQPRPRRRVPLRLLPPPPGPPVRSVQPRAAGPRHLAPGTGLRPLLHPPPPSSGYLRALPGARHARRPYRDRGRAVRDVLRRRAGLHLRHLQQHRQPVRVGPLPPVHAALPGRSPARYGGRPAVDGTARALPDERAPAAFGDPLAGPQRGGPAAGPPRRHPYRADP